MICVLILPINSFAQNKPPAGNPLPSTSGDSSTTTSSTPKKSGDGMLKNPLGKNASVDIGTFFKNVVQGALKIGIPLIALAIMYCGFLYVAARGKPEAITKAHQALLYTLIGAAILLGAWAISELIVTTVGGLAS